MISLLIVALTFAAVWVALDRNHARHLHGRLYGSVDVEDRDAARVRTDLRAVRDHTQTAGYR